MGVALFPANVVEWKDGPPSLPPGAQSALPAGTYGYWEAGMKHFVWIKGETIVQFHGMGPWKIEYVNPADDPRNQKADDRK